MNFSTSLERETISYHLFMYIRLYVVVIVPHRAQTLKVVLFLKYVVLSILKVSMYSVRGIILKNDDLTPSNHQLWMLINCS